jgi:hemerythrin-like domain-containing protein
MKLVSLPNCNVFIAVNTIKTVRIYHHPISRIYNLVVEFLDGNDQWCDLNTHDIDTAVNYLNDFVSKCNQS